MSSSYAEEVSLEENHWYRIVHELLEKADIEINGSRPWDIHINHPGFFKRVLQEGSLGLGESYMDGWWEIYEFILCRRSEPRRKPLVSHRS